MVLGGEENGRQSWGKLLVACVQATHGACAAAETVGFYADVLQ
jgi:hypothetical protein